MITKSLRSSGGDYSTLSAVISFIDSQFPLSDDITIEAEGGATFGLDGYGNNRIGISDNTSVWNGYSITITTKPSERATPAKILGALRTYLVSNGTLGYLYINNIIQYGNFTNASDYVIGGGGGSARWPRTLYENNVFIGRFSTWPTLALIGGYNSGGINSKVNNNTFVITSSNYGAMPQTTMNLSKKAFALSNAQTGAIPFTNNLILINTATISRAILSSPGSIASTHDNVFYDYGSGNSVFSFYNDSVPTNTTTGNPMLEDAAFITSDSEDPAVIVTRSAKLTSGSNTRDIADPATAATIDILGNSRI